jgi:hypothetical protein
MAAAVPTTEHRCNVQQAALSAGIVVSASTANAAATAFEVLSVPFPGT